ncbi:outer membrane beta-barrel protein [Saccharicrinis aurantiacus]|uniref:outer membrane beta-barrel protein n=1 Tax=Saccharicrinis aurantiacus TaxID=1849719 RepID=UPI0011151234|nr:outer membrane beta-barrel protein [Saccharicrinis aurantiacus]
MKNYIKLSLIILVLQMPIAVLNAQIKLSPFISYGSQSVNYDYRANSSKSMMGIGFGADIQYHISEYMIIGSGIRYNEYGATFNLGSFQSEAPMIDQDNDAYILKASGTNIEEEHTVGAIEVPLFFRYQKWISSDFILYGATGPVFSFLGTVKTTINSGSLSTSGYYPQWNLTIDDVPEYGFYTRDITELSTVTEFKTSIAWLIEVGSEYYVSKRLNLAFGLYYQPGLNNISSTTAEGLLTDPNSYTGTINNADKIQLTKAGFKLGVNFDLTPNKRSSVKSIR